MLMTSGTVIVIFWLYMINLQYFFRNISASWPLFILKLDKKTWYLHWKTSLRFYGPFLVGHSVTKAISCLQYLVCNILSTISCLLNRLTFSLRSSCTNGQISHLPWLGLNFPTPAAVLKVKFPTPGEREGVKCPWYAREGACWGYKLKSLVTVEPLRGIQLQRWEAQ